MNSFSITMPCCCCSSKISSVAILIGVFQIMVYALYIWVLGRGLDFMIRERENIHEITEVKDTARAEAWLIKKIVLKSIKIAILSMMVVFGYILIESVKKVSVTLLRFYLIGKGVLIGLFIVLLVYADVVAGRGIEDVLFDLFLLPLKIYLWIVIYDFYQKLQLERRGSLPSRTTQILDDVQIEIHAEGKS